MRYLTLTYFTKADGQIDETMAVTKNLKMSDWQTASVILDFKLQKVEKCFLDGVQVPKVWDTVVSYYYQHYSNIVERLFEENGHPISVAVTPAPSE